MGNRAVITFSTKANAPAIYLHWNGGEASVIGFLTACQKLNIKLDAAHTEKQVMDAIASVIAVFFGVDIGHTVYREEYANTDKDNYDNGVYIINPDLTIKGRRYKPAGSTEINREKTEDIISSILSKAPIFNN